ncbi:GrpB family protein [Staphylococcus caeli]|uniref:GrpB family protein n=1 Tax=Staphylococcus caeli TaxID=2201815 RepID=A0A1D4HJE9_9STAP|nr:GrpB family protein [Staphylococcus caeli]SCS29841.1 putative GrpB family protein [Staphylococcus caeli]SCS37254.1 putative GrpB family protein [Staphylococcus caeli]
MYSQIQPFITEDGDNVYFQKYKHLQNVLFNLLDTPIKSAHHIGGTAHFNYPTEPILDILVGVDNLHDITSLDEKRLNYEGFYRLHHPYTKKVVMAKFNNLIDLKQVARLHIIQKDSSLYNDYLHTHQVLTQNQDVAAAFALYKNDLSDTNLTIREYENQKQQWFSSTIHKLHQSNS